GKARGGGWVRARARPWSAFVVTLWPAAGPASRDSTAWASAGAPRSTGRRTRTRPGTVSETAMTTGRPSTRRAGAAVIGVPARGGRAPSSRLPARGGPPGRRREAPALEVTVHVHAERAPQRRDRLEQDVGEEPEEQSGYPRYEPRVTGR